MNAELRTKLVEDLLSVDDTMSMAHSLELRVPLLDNRIVDLMAIVPWQMKYQSGTHGKLLLRKAVRGILPEESLRKPKWGFSVNVQAWFRGEVGELVRQILPESEVIQKYFRADRVRKLIVSTTNSDRERRQQVLLWQLLGFHLWHRIFIDSDRVGAANRWGRGVGGLTVELPGGASSQKRCRTHQANTRLPAQPDPATRRNGDC